MTQEGGCRKVFCSRDVPERSEAGRGAAAGAARTENLRRPACARRAAEGDRTDVTGFTSVTALSDQATSAAARS
jgi:hypothetical protein